MFKEFEADELFEIKKGKRLTKADMKSGDINFIGSTSSNNGVTAKIGNTEHLHPAHTITVSYNGSVGEVFLQDEPFWASDDVNVWYPKIKIDDRALLYIMTLIKKLSAKYSYTAKWTIDKMRAEKLSLPVIETSDSNHEYTIEDIDFEYMQERISELEQERISELDAYLVASGLDDYELTDEDKEILSLSPESASDEAGASEADCEDGQIRFKKYAMHDIFEPIKVKKAKKADVRGYKTNEFCVPVVYAKFGDNGIMYWGRKGEFTAFGNVISIVYNGVISAGKVYAQEEPTGILAESYLIRYKYGEVPFLANLYMAQVIEHKIYPLYSRENLAIWNKRVENEVIELPVTASGDVNFDYMERYIRAIEKLAIADVAKYKDKLIATTRQVVGA